METINDLGISPNEDFVLIKRKEDVYNSIMKTKSKFAILTVFKERKKELVAFFKEYEEKIKSEDPTATEIFIGTPKDLVISNLSPNTLIFLEEPHLMSPFGYEGTLKALKKEGVNFVALTSNESEYSFLENAKSRTTELSSFVKCKKDQEFSILFAIIKFNVFHSQISIVASDEVVKYRIQLFLKIFGYKYWENVFLKDDIFDKTKVIVFGKDKMPFKSIDTLYLSHVEIPDAKKVDFDFGKITKFEYKIGDVLRSLSPAVCKKKKSFNIKCFSNLNNILR